MKTQRGALLNSQIMRSKTEKWKKNSKIKKLGSFFDFHTKTAKTPKPRNAIGSRNTWIWRLKFCRRYHNEPYYWLFAISIGSERKSKIFKHLNLYPLGNVHIKRNTIFRIFRPPSPFVTKTLPSFRVIRNGSLFYF